MSLEDILKSLATQQFEQDTRASIQNLENQVSQLALTVGKLESHGKFPFHTIPNSKQNAFATTLRNEKELESIPPTPRDNGVKKREGRKRN